MAHDLDTIEGARAWLTDPNNWHETQLYILKWNGMVPTIMKRHGQHLVDNPTDNDLPWCVVYERRRLRRQKSDPNQPKDPSDPSNVEDSEV